MQTTRRDPGVLVLCDSQGRSARRYHCSDEAVVCQCMTSKLTRAIGGGCWHPEALYVGRMRNSIDGNSQALKDVLSEDTIRKEFLGDAKKSHAAVVKAFVKSNSDNALKTRPKVSLSLSSRALGLSTASPLVVNGHRTAATALSIVPMDAPLLQQWSTIRPCMSGFSRDLFTRRMGPGDEKTVTA